MFPSRSCQSTSTPTSGGGLAPHAAGRARGPTFLLLRGAPARDARPAAAAARAAALARGQRVLDAAELVAVKHRGLLARAGLLDHPQRAFDPPVVAHPMHVLAVGQVLALLVRKRSAELGCSPTFSATAWATARVANIASCGEPSPSASNMARTASLSWRAGACAVVPPPFVAAPQGFREQPALLPERHGGLAVHRRGSRVFRLSAPPRTTTTWWRPRRCRSLMEATGVRRHMSLGRVRFL